VELTPPTPLVKPPTMPDVTGLPPIEVYRHVGHGKEPILVVSSDQKQYEGRDLVALGTYQAAVDVVGYFSKTFGRAGADDAGSAVKIIVGYEDVPGKPVNNAFWDATKGAILFGDGDGDTFSPLGTARDVMAHEFSHAIIDSEVKLAYRGEEGGIHETLADLWATGVDGNMTIGETVYTPNVPGDALRDLNNLTWKHTDDLPVTPPYVDEPHVMGEPLTHAAVLASQSVGIDNIRKIWYTATIDHLKDHSGYAGFRQATEAAALQMYDVDTQKAISDAWEAVGVK